METIVKPRKYSVSVSGAESLAELQDIDFARGNSINQEKETRSIVFRVHGRGQYALEMVRKVDNEVGFIGGVATVSHKFATKPSIMVLDGDSILPIDTIVYSEGSVEITLVDTMFTDIGTVILS